MQQCITNLGRDPLRGYGYLNGGSIVLQLPQLNPQFAYRLGAAGTALYKDNDQPFKSSESSQKGLQGRMTQ